MAAAGGKKDGPVEGAGCQGRVQRDIEVGCQIRWESCVYIGRRAWHIDCHGAWRRLMKFQSLNPIIHVYDREMNVLKCRQYWILFSGLRCFLSNSLLNWRCAVWTNIFPFGSLFSGIRLRRSGRQLIWVLHIGEKKLEMLIVSNSDGSLNIKAVQGCDDSLRWPLGDVWWGSFAGKTWASSHKQGALIWPRNLVHGLIIRRTWSWHGECQFEK